ncbi:MAG: hypothetical protein RL220_83 [Bacteroidota bacterium]|jgi:hypothetical protein
MNRIAGFCLMLTVIGCQLNGLTQEKLNRKDVHRLAQMMAGEFSSQKQSEKDSAFFHITLRMQPIWTQRPDGYWFYVEQAMASAKDKPYRQRVYHLSQRGDTSIVSQVFELFNPARFIGAEPSDFEQVTTDSLIARTGCSILLTMKSKKKFAGSTVMRECTSTLRGATYATSEVVITRGMMVSWDRGWNDAGEQVWGATKGGYEFRKIRDFGSQVHMYRTPNF